MNTLDLTPLRNALASLDATLALLDEPGLATRPAHQDAFRAAAIQKFEFTYEVAWKMLRRRLTLDAADPDSVTGMPFADLIRTGADRGLLRKGWPAWRAFREARAITGDTYDAAKAALVLERIPAFREEAAFLLARLEAPA